MAALSMNATKNRMHYWTTEGVAARVEQKESGEWAGTILDGTVNYTEWNKDGKLINTSMMGNDRADLILSEPLSDEEGQKAWEMAKLRGQACIVNQLWIPSLYDIFVETIPFLGKRAAERRRLELSKRIHEEYPLYKKQTALPLT